LYSLLARDQSEKVWLVARNQANHAELGLDATLLARDEWPVSVNCPLSVRVQFVALMCSGESVVKCHCPVNLELTALMRC
jgi:hypothetical protein